MGTDLGNIPFPRACSFGKNLSAVRPPGKKGGSYPCYGPTDKTAKVKKQPENPPGDASDILIGGIKSMSIE